MEKQVLHANRVFSSAIEPLLSMLSGFNLISSAVATICEGLFAAGDPSISGRSGVCIVANHHSQVSFCIGFWVRLDSRLGFSLRQLFVALLLECK